MSTPNTVKTQIQSLIASANATTGKADTDLTSAVGSLVEGFVQGGGSEDESVYHVRHVGGITSLFRGAILPETCEEIVIESSVPLFEDAQHVFRDLKNVKKASIRMKSVNDSVAYSINSMCMSSDLEELDLTGMEGENGVLVSTLTYFLSGASKIRIVKGELNCSKQISVWVYNSSFANAKELEEIRFTKNTIGGGVSFASCAKLSDTSIQSIIDGLADLTGQTALTINFNQTVKAKLTETQIATITNKNWTLA